MLCGAGLVWSAAVLDQLTYGWLVPGYVAMGVGLALVMTPASTDAMNCAPARFRGEASGVMQTVRQVGGTVGLAAMGTIVAQVQSDRLVAYADRVGATPAQRSGFERLLTQAHGNPSALKGVAPQALGATKDALAAGISSAYYVGGAVMIAGALVAWLLLRRVRAADATRPPVTPGAHPALRVAAR